MRVVHNLCIIHHFCDICIGGKTDGSIQRISNIIRRHSRTVMEFYILFDGKVYAHTIFSDLPAFCQHRLKYRTVGGRFSYQGLIDLSRYHTEVRVRRSNATRLQRGGFYNRDKGDGVFVGAFTISYCYSAHGLQCVIHSNVTGRRSRFAAFFGGFRAFRCFSGGFIRSSGSFVRAAAAAEKKQAAHYNAKPYCPFSFHFFCSSSNVAITSSYQPTSPERKPPRGRLGWLDSCIHLGLIDRSEQSSQIQGIKQFVEKLLLKRNLTFSSAPSIIRADRCSQLHSRRNQRYLLRRLLQQKLR